MDHTTFENLRAIINDENLAKAAAHPDWAAAINNTLSNIDFPFRPKDVDKEVTLLYILTLHSFGVDAKGRLYREETNFESDALVYVKGKWVEAEEG